MRRLGSRAHVHARVHGHVRAHVHVHGHVVHVHVHVHAQHGNVVYHVVSTMQNMSMYNMVSMFMSMSMSMAMAMAMAMYMSIHTHSFPCTYHLHAFEWEVGVLTRASEDAHGVLELFGTRPVQRREVTERGQSRLHVEKIEGTVDHLRVRPRPNRCREAAHAGGGRGCTVRVRRDRQRPIG